MRSILMLLFLASATLAQTPTLRETWDSGYQGKDANGPQVLGYWKFDAGAELKDSSGKGHDLTNHGAQFSPVGRFGGAVESFPGFPVEDKAHGLQTVSGAGLSPKGAFTLELWLSTKADFQAEQRCFLLDKKYVSDDDYQWTFGPADKGGLRRMTVNLGFGARSELYHSEPVRLEAGVWHHVAFTYDANGAGRFYFDGQAWGGGDHPGAKAISAGRRPLTLADRGGSNYGGFPGYLDEVRLCDGVLEFGRVKLQLLTERTVWRRMEEKAPVSTVCRNLDREPLRGAQLIVGVPGADDRRVPVPELAPGAEFRVDERFDTALKAGTYHYRARLELKEPKPYETEETATLQIVNRPLPNRMPIVMWGGVGDDFTKLKEIGFTHCLGLGVDYGSIWNAKKPVLPADLEKSRRMLDKALANDVSLIASLSPSRFLEAKPGMLRVDRAGKPYERKDICASLPELPPFFEHVGEAVAQAYGDHPAFQAALIDSEVRDNSRPSFNAVDVANYRAYSGHDIPAEVVGRNGVNWQKLPNFPADRVIADDDAILQYYRWFWTVGDGWNGLHTALHKGVKSGGRPDVWTFFDPAVRAPSIHGSGGQVDVLSHWTYTYPDPQRIGLAADQLFALSAANGANQRVMKMTQLIWYRSQTAPAKPSTGGPATPVAWEDHDPDAAYITIAPMHLREALWTKLARPISGIMYHGWSSLVENAPPSSYRYTNPNTQYELQRLIHEVVEPLGPTLLQLQDQPHDVGFLESFTSQMFAGRGGYGSNMSWATDVWLALQHAHVTCDILYEEMLEQRLDQYKVLVAPECDVLTKSAAEKIKAWQAKGGVLIGDELLCPAVKAQTTVASFKREKKAVEDHAKTLALATQLPASLKTARGAFPVECDQPNVIVRARAAGDAHYLFVVNDKREPGTYVGQHNLVMENGLPTEATITFLKGQPHVYDLVSYEPVATNADGTHSAMKITLGPCEGRVYLVVPDAIKAVQVEMPLSATSGKSVEVNVTVSGNSGKTVGAVIPVELAIRDASGHLAEGSGFYGANDGKLTVKLDLAPNDDPGTWEVTATEMASRKRSTAYLRVTK